MAKTRRKPEKPTVLELERRVELVARLWLSQATKTEIHEYCRKNFNVHWVTADRYVLRAKKWCADRSSLSAAAAKNLGVNVLLGALRNARTPREIVTIETRLAEIFGYNAPRRMETTGADGGPIEFQERPLEHISSERLRELAGEAVDAALGGNGNGEQRHDT